MALLNTDLLTARTQSFRSTRHMFASLLREGVAGTSDYAVTPGGASLQWSVAAGAAWVQGDDTTRQGLYPQVNDAAVTGLVSAGHATLPRLDQVILRVFDSSVTGVSDTPTLSTLAGTATAGATLDNRNGAAALPNTALRVADILVPAAHSGVLTSGMIRDRRPIAAGRREAIVGSSSGPTTTSTSFVLLTDMTFSGEFTGRPVRLDFTGTFANSGTNWNTLAFYLDGAQVGQANSHRWTTAAYSQVLSKGLLIPGPSISAGRHTIEMRWSVTAGTGTAEGVARELSIVEL